MNLGLKNKKALVWGASQGIGAAIAKSLKDEGCTVTIASRSPDKLEKTAKDISADHFIQTDLSKKGDAANSIQIANEKMKGVDILIINTGGPEKNSFENVSTEQWEVDFQSLWMSTVDGIKESIKLMKENDWGRIVLISSIAAKEPLDGLTTSNGLRAGLSGLFKSITNEVAHFGITLNIVCPGYTNTERLQSLNLKQDVIEKLVPAGRLGDPSEIADLVTYLSSDKAGYITGQQISVDGGSLKGHY